MLFLRSFISLFMDLISLIIISRLTLIKDQVNFLLLFEFLVVIYAATWITVEPKLEKIKKESNPPYPPPPKKNILFQEMEWNFLTPRKRNNTF